MKDKAQKRLLTLLVLATFAALRSPLKTRFVGEPLPGKRGPKEDVAEALVQGAARMGAVVLASTAVRMLAGGGFTGNRQQGSGDNGAVGKGREEDAETLLRVLLEPRD